MTFSIRQSYAFEEACEALDITRITKTGRLRTDDEMKRLIELKRLFKGKGILEPVRLKGHCERVYRFPHDIWWIIG